MPVEPDSKGVPEIDHATQDKKLSMWMAYGKGKLDPHQWPLRGGHRGVPVGDGQKRMGSVDSSSSRTSRWLERESEESRFPIYGYAFFSTSHVLNNSRSTIRKCY